MKPVFLFITILYFSQISNAQKPHALLKEMGLKGNVKEVTDSLYNEKDATNKNDQTRQPIKRVTEFNEKGNGLRETATKDGKIIGKTIYNYLENKTLSVEYFDDKNDLTIKDVYKFDTEGNEIEIDNMYGPEFNYMTKSLFKYDLNGRKTENQLFNNEGQLSKRYILSYNDKNEEIEEDLIDLEFNENEKTIFEYNSQGFLIKTETFNSKKELIEEDLFTYGNLDKYGNWTQRLYEIKRYNESKTGKILKKQVTYRSIKYF